MQFSKKLLIVTYYHVNQCIPQFTNAIRLAHQTPKTPDLIYVPHVLRWLKTKIRLMYLKKVWDPEFSEGAFIYGTTQAVCKITDIIHKDSPEELRGLLTSTARIKLTDDMSHRITPLQKKIIKLTPDDIKILIPTAVNMRSDGFTKKCNVSLRCLGLKWFEDGPTLRLVLVTVQTEFVRDYTRGALPEWIISIFNVLECGTLSGVHIQS